MIALRPFVFRMDVAAGLARRREEMLSFVTGTGHIAPRERRRWSR